MMKKVMVFFHNSVVNLKPKDKAAEVLNMVNIKINKLNIDVRAVLKKITEILFLALPFLLMDFFIRRLTAGIRYEPDAFVFAKLLFTTSWISLILLFSLLLKRKIGRIVYGVSFFSFFLLFVTQLVYFPYTGFFFSFNLVQSADEGSAYIVSTLANAGVKTYLICALVLVLGIFAIIKFPKHEKNKWKVLSIIFAAFVALHFVVPVFFGRANKTLEWNTWNNPRNVYKSFGDSNKNIKICGFYEYTARDFYVTFMRPEDKANPDELAFLNSAYEKRTPHEKNEFSGIFEGKNVIFLQLEGIDSWLLTEQDMPTLYGMMKNSIVFDNHYSYYNGGGSTFNSELAVSTGFMTPISYTENPYAFNTNYFPFSLPNRLKESGYRTNAFHMNTGEFYMRALNYRNWGYDRYFSLLDDCNYTDGTHQLDTELVKNPLFYENMFKKEQPFMNYVITYTPHTPFYLDAEVGTLLTKRVYGEGYEVADVTEEEAARFFATETDNMIKLMLEALKREGLYENTVIVAFSDHYLYTLNDKTILDKYKKTENNLINHTPFIIWSPDIAETHISKVNSQIDILPTVLNMLGVEYNDEDYIGHDIMEDRFSGYAFFSDLSWYDGENYVEFGKVVGENVADPKYISETNERINRAIKKNDLALKYDYFRK